MTPLADGTLLVTGGNTSLTSTASITATAERYDPVANARTSVATMPAVRYLHTGTLLASGKVLVAGGYIDRTASVITPSIGGTLGEDDWYVSDADLTWTVTDAESPVGSRVGCDLVEVHADQASTTYTCTATSEAVTGGPVGTLTATCSGARDNAGNSADAVTATYAVRYAFDGFLRPIDNGVWNARKAGAAVPVKFSLAGDQGLAILADGSPSSRPIDCDTGAPSDTGTPTHTAGSPACPTTSPPTSTPASGRPKRHGPRAAGCSP